MIRLRQYLALGVVLGAAACVWGQNCCMPRLEDEGEPSNRLVDGIQSATLVLVAAPFALVAAIGWRVWKWQTIHRLADSGPRSDESNVRASSDPVR